MSSHGEKEDAQRIKKIEGDITEIKETVKEIWNFIADNSRTARDVAKLHSVEIKLLKKELCDLKSEIDKVINNVSSFDKKLKSVKSESDCKLKAHKKRLTEDTAQKIKKQNVEVKREVKKLTRKNIPFGRNVVIHGIKKDEKGSDVDWFKKFCKEILKIEPIIENGVIKKTKRGHFIGIFTLKSKEEKGKIFRNCYKLKDSRLNLSVKDDFLEEGCYQAAQMTRKGTSKMNQSKTTTGTESDTDEQKCYAGVVED